MSHLASQSEAAREAAIEVLAEGLYFHEHYDPIGRPLCEDADDAIKSLYCETVRRLIQRDQCLLKAALGLESRLAHHNGVNRRVQPCEQLQVAQQGLLAGG